ncbi:MAG: diacylglycerol kinase [Candidatus Omnitrophota bacterium]|jgi:diacylglycerol kinase (ATP)
MHERKFVESLNAAVEGFIYVMKTERNMRAHFLVALFIIILGIYLNLATSDLLILCITITLVLSTEMVNTAVELTVDMIKSEFHPIARIIKDVAAGAVLLTAINAAIVGYMLFSKKMPFGIEDAVIRLRQSPWHLTFISLILVLGLTILGKIAFHRGTPLRGGMPSGHAAIAFSIWTIVVFMTNNFVVITLVFLMAFLIARHRVKDYIHTVAEVVAGAILGILATTLVFQLFR